MTRNREVRTGMIGLAGIVAAALLVAMLALPAATANAADYPFFDDMENQASGNWTFGGAWGYTTEAAYSGSTSFTDSPGTTYENSVDVKATLASGIDLSSAAMPVLSFWERYVLETNADFGYVDVSTDGGSSWSTIYFVNGTELGWVE
ncbi:MAG: hypothetical protein ABIE42_05390, partial [Candidatus Eisenbacteria bacterium]